MTEGIDITDSFRDDNVRDETNDETFPLIPLNTTNQINVHDVQETSFGGLQTQVLQEHVRGLYERLSSNTGQLPTLIHSDLFEIENGELYLKGNRSALTNNGRLRPIGVISDILGKKGLRNLGFDIPKSKLTARQATMLNNLESELPSSSTIAKASDVELDQITERLSNSSEDLISLTSTVPDDLFHYPLRELLGLDKELKNIRGSLKIEMAKKIEIEHHIAKEKRKLAEMKNDLMYTEEQRNEVLNRKNSLEENLTARQESINILKGKLQNQLTSIKETIAKVLDSDTSLAERIRTLFREQGVTIISILTAFGMAIGLLVEAILPNTNIPNKGNDGDKNQDTKEWIKNKLKALASIIGKLADKAVDALPAIIGSVISWILNRAKEAIGWLSQNLWALIVGIVGLIYTYIITRK